AHKMLVAHAFAEADVYRACTHNKGILNGVDAVALATGNDTRAIEAAAHAYAARSGAYGVLTNFNVDERGLHAELTMPLAIGVVGGNCAIHQGVKVAHKILGNFAHSGLALARAMVSVGLAQCLAALLALSLEGIQQGHMKLHKKKLLLKNVLRT
ncbi:MAG TPA: hydroxymethylglutaryl-CoA reductase, partial [Myxococcota bacterium]|nr:hydroxymethylglutaryl-CoA reductase [Myxococcota bacterium]